MNNEKLMDANYFFCFCYAVKFDTIIGNLVCSCQFNKIIGIFTDMHITNPWQLFLTKVNP
ncbi:hypothetical protein SAMN05444487_105124 [Marininema mesophilum]|uniref:Uncharacterized protein n=1 Tax=Marininema mesophilum TaxID=1048340 RepID=A0A1H2VK47_9BACL|nr:hypothetical protein SAMN05444487_105124 [Marininema mesophilum]